MRRANNNYGKIVIADNERPKWKNNMTIIAAAQKMPVLLGISGTCGGNLQSFHTSLLKVSSWLNFLFVNKIRYLDSVLFYFDLTKFCT